MRLLIDDDLCDDSVSCTVMAKSRVKKRLKARIIRSPWFNKESHPEKHYCELIMLFSPWRNEEKRLIRNYSSFKERYSELSDRISEQIESMPFAQKT